MNTTHTAPVTREAGLESLPPTDSFGGDGKGPGGYYTPGHALRKVLMVLLGLCLLGVAATHLWTPLRLLLAGTRTTAEATRVIKSKEGLADLAFTDDLQVRQAQESHDRSYLFTNEFRFRTAEGQQLTVTLPTRSQLKPLYPLLDEDGLPTTVWICYDPHDPQRVVFPMVFSTWFIPGTLAFLGAVCTAIGATLLYWARKPIELPRQGS